LCVERCFASLASAGSGTRPAIRAATAFFWFGMITIATDADIQVATMAPVCRNAARPLNTSVKPYAAATMKAKTTAPSAASLPPSGDLHKPS